MHAHLAATALAIAVLAGCTEAGEPSARSAAGPADAANARQLSIEAFAFVGPSVTMQDVMQRVGPPEKDVGSGLHVYLYRLDDGSEVHIGSADGTQIIYLRHAGRLVYPPD